jgi:sec-independent protein translocase protein TatA
MRIGPTELIIILVIVLVLFGVGRIGKIAGELGSGIRAFKDGLRGPDEPKTDEKSSPKEPDKIE